MLPKVCEWTVIAFTRNHWILSIHSNFTNKNVSWLHFIHLQTEDMVTCNLSLRFNDHFPGEPGLAGVYWSKGWWRVVVTTGAISCAKLQSNHHHQQTNIQFFTDQMPFLLPNQQCQSTEGKISHYMELLTPSSPGCLGSSNFVPDHFSVCL